MGPEFSAELLKQEEFVEFEVRIATKSIERIASLNSIAGQFWNGEGRALLDAEFLAPTSFIANRSSISLSQPMVPPSYPAEWTGKMLAKAGLQLLDFLETELGKSVRLNESYSRNFQFFLGNPKWVDLGSFSLVGSGLGGFKSFQELQFLKNYIIPTKLRIQGKEALAAGILNVHSLTSMNVDETLRLAPSLHLKAIQFVSPKLRVLISQAIFAPLWLESTPTPLRNSKLGSRMFSIFTRGIALPLLKMRIRGYRRLLTKAHKQAVKSEWAVYGGRIDKGTARFDLVERKISEIGPSTVTDVGGNRGYVGLRALENRSIQRYIVLDWDPVAIDSVNQKAIELTESRLFGFRFNAANPWTDSQAVGYQHRFSSDLVVCLALTHHLLLTSQMSYSRMWRLITSLTKRDILVEFMPKGLWSKSGAGYITPDWYSEENFVQSIPKEFVIVSRDPVEENRVLFHLRRK
ncbi:hypothetical protein N9M34_00555 [Aquiluna sp.]|nr:hypothetical protein [Aquiluna sp.]